MVNNKPKQKYENNLFIGRNEIIINQKTMAAIVQRWLNEEMPNNKTKVVGVGDTTGDGNCENFRVIIIKQI